jgi:hypothetical protein
LEELPSVADRILASQIMAESGLELEEAPSVDPVFTPSFVDEAFDGVDTDPIELADFPDNLNDAMDYLDQLAAGRQQSQEFAGTAPPLPADAAIPTGDEAPVTTPAVEELVATAGEEEADEVQIEESVLVASSVLEEVAYEEMAPDEVASESEFIHDELSESEVEPQELTDEEQTVEPVPDLASDLEEVTDEEMAPEEMILEFARDELAESEVEAQELADEEQTAEPVLDLASDLEEVTDEEVPPEEVTLEFIPDELAESEVEPQQFADDEQEMELSEEITEAVDEVDTADAVVILEAETSPALQVSSFELALALTRLDRLSLPPDVTLESLDETLADDYSSELNGHHDNLDDALLWLEQQLDAADMITPSNEMGANAIGTTQEPENAPDELLLEVASLDDEVVAELTTDMPDDPDEALTWLMNLTEEVLESETEPEIMVIPYPEAHGARVYDLVEVVDPVDEPEPPAAGQVTSEIAVESQASSVELEQPEVEPLAAGDLPEMPDDPDEAIAWIERLAAMEEQESRLGLGDVEGVAEPQRGEGDSVIADSSAIAIPQSAIFQEDEKAVAYETYDEADIADEERMSDERIDENEASESLDPMPVEQPAARQPHERWLDLLQPPAWLHKG